MNIKTRVMVIVFSVFSCLALANELPQGAVDSATWLDFEVNSADGSYVAEVKALGNQKGTSVDKKAYTLIISKIVNDGRQWFWQCNYDYDGYSSGMLSNDGSTFVYVRKYYDNKKPIIKIYRLGNRIAFLYGSSFNVNMANLKTDNNGKLWLDRDLQGAKFFYRGRMPPLLEITTTDKRKYNISIESGKFISN